MHPQTQIPDDDDEIMEPVVPVNNSNNPAQEEDDPEDFIDSLFGGNINTALFDELETGGTSANFGAERTSANFGTEGTSASHTNGRYSTTMADTEEIDSQALSPTPSYPAPTIAELNIQDQCNLQPPRSPSVTFIDERCIPSSSRPVDFQIGNEHNASAPSKRKVSFIDLDEGEEVEVGKRVRIMHLHQYCIHLIYSFV